MQSVEYAGKAVSREAEYIMLSFATKNWKMIFCMNLLPLKNDYIDENRFSKSKERGGEVYG